MDSENDEFDDLSEETKKELDELVEVSFPYIRTHRDMEIMEFIFQVCVDLLTAEKFLKCLGTEKRVSTAYAKGRFCGLCEAFRHECLNPPAQLHRVELIKNPEMES